MQWDRGLMQKIIRKLNISEFEKNINELKYNEYFTEKERELYGKRRKKGSLAARYILKNIIIEKIDKNLKYSDIEILNNDFGKPFLAIHKLEQEILKKIHFSISHSKDDAIVLFVIDTDDL